MSLPFSRYVNIVSGVGGGAGVRQRDLILRLFTASPMIGPDTVLEFTRANLAAIALYFGADSEEYKRAAAYFSFVSPNTTAPERIAFASYRPVAAQAAIYGNRDYKSIGTLQSVNAGTLTIAVDDVPTLISNVDLGTAANMADVATALQTALLAAGVPDATVIFAEGRFTVTAEAGKISIASAATGGNDLARVMGLSVAVGAIDVSGSDAVNAVTAVQQSEAISDNFGTLAFIPQLALADAEAVAAYVAAANVKYQYHIGVSRANAADWATALSGYAGTGLTLSPITGEYPELLPPAVLAATRYDRRNSVVGYMFRQMAGLTATVRSEAEADSLDTLRVNYYGDTSTAGQVIKFYQRGTLMGGPTDPVDMNTYANEQWLKDYAGSQIMGLLLGVARVPANDQGVGMISNIIQPAIDRALNNGVISVGKALTPQQRVFLAQATGDELAYLVVQSQGYILKVRMENYTTTSGAVEYKAVYELYYSKDDAIRRVDGFHSLI